MINYTDLIGVPCVNRGRDAELGLDCYGLVKEVYKRNGTDIPEYDTDYNDMERINELIEGNTQGYPWKEIKEPNDGKIPFTFIYKFEKGKQPKTVLLCGSFSNWKEKLPLTFDPFTERWSITIRLERGKHSYKYIIDDKWQINDMERHENQGGNENNVIEI